VDEVAERQQPEAEKDLRNEVAMAVQLEDEAGERIG
jgi:hypothetical protein